MLLKNKTIAIVGGGPGGLTLARLLQQKGANVTVYERDADKNVRQQGATLDLHHDTGLKALETAGLMGEFKKHYRPGAEKMIMTDDQATIFLNDHEQVDVAFDNEHHRPEIDRGPLRDILIASLQPNTIIWNAQFSTMEKSNNGWQLHFKNGSVAYADIVIAADGANSKIRPFINDIKPIYSGITVVEGNIYNSAKNAPKLHAFLKGGKVFALGHEQSLILSAKGDGSISFYTGCKDEENWVTKSGIDFTNKQQVFEWFKERFQKWSPMWQELFAGDEIYFVPRPMYHYPLDQSWMALPNLTMIGDAAHRMPPYAGEGVNMAMADALELSEWLTESDCKDVQSAIAGYEKQMCVRAAEITRATLDSTVMLHGPDALQQFLSMFKENDV